MIENFIPSFKEKDKEQYYYKNNNWIKCDETMINSLWNNWVVSENCHRYFDDDGFLIYGYNRKKND